MIDLSAKQLQAFDLLPHPVWVFGQDSLKVLAANAAACDWLGYPRDGLVGTSITDIRPPGEREALRARIAAFLADEQADVAAYPDAWQIRARSGATHHASVHWRKVMHDGRPAVLATFTDLTDEHRVHQRLREREAELAQQPGRAPLSDSTFARLFDAAPGQMLVLCPETHRIVAGTADFARATGKRPSQLRGRSFFDAFPPASREEGARDAERLRRSFHLVARSKSADVLPVIRCAITGPDGVLRARSWSIVNTPVLDDRGAVEFIIVRVLDVTELSEHARRSDASQGDASAVSGLLHDLTLRADETETRLVRLASLEARLRSAEELLGMGEWEYDLDLQKSEWSERVYEIYGWPRDRPAPDRESYYDLIHPDDKPLARENALAFREGASGKYEFRHRIVRPDGEVRVMRGIGKRYRLGGRDRVIGVVQDITEIIGITAELQEAAHLINLAGEKAQLGGWRVDLDRNRLTWTAGTFRIHEIESGEEPSLEAALAFYAPGSSSVISDAFERCATEGRDFDEIAELVTAKGNRIWVRAIGMPVRDASGRIVAVQGALQDMSDLRRTEERLNEELFQRANVLENISDAFFTLDEDWRFTYVNAEAERLLLRRRDELLDRVIWDEFPAAIGSAFQTTYERVRSDGRSRRFSEYYAPLETWFEVNANAVPDGLAVYFRDVTQDRRRNEQLRLLGLAVENLNDMVLVTDANLDAPDGPRITFLNPAFSRFMGYSSEDVLGRTPRMFQGPETDRAERSRIRAALEQGQPVRGELINYRHNGQPYWLELAVNPVHDEAGEVVSFVAIQRDISERKQVEQDNRINEERFRLVASMASDAIWDLDLQTGKLWWSRGLTEIFGHASDPDQWTTTTWREHVHPDDLQRILRLEEDAMDSGARRFTQEYRFRMGDGSWALVSDNGIIFRDDAGKPVRMLGSLSNISEKRAADERRQQAQRLEAIGQLTGGVAHDFNNILTVILGNAEMLLDHLGNDAQAHAMADVTIRAAERGAELTDRLLAFARRKPLEPEVLDLNKRLPAVEALIRRTLPESVDIRIDRAPGLWATEVDPGQLEVALLNLAVNARDAMPDGGSLTIETHNTWLDESYAASHSEVSAGDYVLLSVSDTGHGMDQDTLQRAFEPFYTTKEVGKGSGLGLSMVFGFVKQSGGHLKIYSEIGEGTTIKIYFPRVHLEPTQADAAVERRRLPRGNEQILVVEDDAPVRENLCNQLLSLGYQVSSAPNADAAMKIVLERDDIDLLLTDVIMPGSMHGGELAKAATAVRPELRVLFTSGYTENAIVHNGRLDAGVAFLGKPYRLRELAQKVRVALGSEQSSQRQR